MGAPVYAFVHLAAQLVFSSEIIVSHRFTKSDHFSGESAFTSPMSEIRPLSRRAVARYCCHPCRSPLRVSSVTAVLHGTANDGMVQRQAAGGD